MKVENVERNRAKKRKKWMTDETKLIIPMFMTRKPNRIIRDYNNNGIFSSSLEIKCYIY